MKETLQFLLSDFWIWMGFVWILIIILDFIFKIYNRTLRAMNIRKHGYPPAHCNADGDFRPINKEDVNNG
jgi:hypothetical protein